MDLRVNLLCFAGVIVALSSLFLVWGTRLTTSLHGYYGYDFHGWDFLFMTSYIKGTELYATIFVISSIFALLTPLSGIGQIIGSAGFLMMGATHNPSPQVEDFWGGTGIGAAVGFVGGVIVLLSAIFPVGIGYPWKKTDMVGRLITVSPSDPSLLRCNGLAVAGASLGIICVSFTWTAGDPMVLWSSQHQNLVIYLVSPPSSWDLLRTSTAFFAGAWMFIIGALITLIRSPLGGFLMLAGAFQFMLANLTFAEGHPGLMSVKIGSYIGMTAAVLTIASIPFPVGIGYGAKLSGMKARITTWGVLGS